MRRSAIGVAFAVASYMVVAAGYHYLFARPLPFDRAQWDAHSADWGDDRHRRHRMADQLLLTDELIGKERDQVVALLGEPLKTGYFSDWSLVYWLGAERGFINIDSEWLVMRTDERQRVIEARLVRD